MKLSDFDIEEIIEHVATWPTSDETNSPDDYPDPIDDWIMLARKLRTRDRRAAFCVVTPSAFKSPCRVYGWQPRLRLIRKDSRCDRQN